MRHVVPHLELGARAWDLAPHIYEAAVLAAVAAAA